MTALKKFSIISLLLLISSGSMSCMELLTIELPHKKIEKRNKDIKTKSIQILRNFYQNKDIADPNADIRVINNRCALMQEKINDKYKALSMCIQQMYTIDFDFCTFFQNIDKHITITNEQKENIPSKVSTQQEFDHSYFLSYLKKTLRRNNFGESVVTFTNNNNKPSSTSPIFSSRIEDDLLHIHVDKPGYINIPYYILANPSLNVQRGCCIALVNQFKHLITTALLYHMVNAMTEKNINEKEFYTLILPNKRLSLLSLAHKNAQATRLLLSFCTEDKDNILLTTREYTDLCKIDKLHSVLTWLKEYEQNNPEKNKYS